MVEKIKVIVRFKKGVGKDYDAFVKGKATEHGIDPVFHYPSIRSSTFIATESQITALRSDPDVLSVEVDNVKIKKCSL